MNQKNFRKWGLVVLGAIALIIAAGWFALHGRHGSPQTLATTGSVNPSPELTPILQQPSLPANTVAAAPENSSPRPDLEKFRDWCARYQQESDAAAKARLESEGETLALQRRDAMARLIEEDPQRALKEAMPFAQRQQLPPSIAAHVEQAVSGRGTLAVLGVLPEEGAENQTPGIVRKVELGGKSYRAFVYGRRLSQSTVENIPLHGIAVGDALAVHESPVRVLESAEATARAGEIAPQNARCPVSGTAISVEDAAAVVDVGGQIRILCNGGHIEVLEGQLLAAEGTGGTVLAAGTLDAWAQGPKTLLYIRVRFSDQTADPQTLADSQTMINGVDSFFREASYETTTIAATFTPVYTLSNNTAYYTSNDIYAVRNDALAIAKADGFDSVNWNLDAVRYNGGPGAFSGAAYVHARGCWLKSSSAGVAAHEFGHNYGLYHANSLNPTDESPIGPGTWQEYGDSFDTMGSASAGAYHYNPRYKSVLNWIAPDGFQTASNSGTYRIYAHDVITSSNSIRGLRVPRNSTKNYWVDFRQKFTGNPWLMNGAGIRRANNANDNNPGSELLDMTPNSPDGKNDSALLIGRTFSDSSAGVHITPVGKGGTSPESLDVVVNFGTFPNNNAPSLAISASSTAVPVGTPVTFTASASDLDGDALAFSWDFDDKTYGFNTWSASKSWSVVGEYVVRCVVSDMKGGTASRWIVITVGSPATYRLSGRVTDSLGAPMQGVRVHNGKTGSIYRGCFTDVDGYYTIANQAAGSYTVGAAYYGFVLNPSGFANPLTLGPSKTGVNFVGTIRTYSISGRVTSGGVAVPDVQVSDGTRTAMSNANGDYLITNMPDGSYTLTATKSGSTFNPSGWSNPITIVGANSTNNFVAPTYVVSGEITGVAVTTVVTVTDGYRTTSSFKQGSGTQTKNVYNLSGVPAGTWNFRAVLPGSTFSPANFTNPLNVTGNASSKNFALDAAPTYSISGSIAYNGAALAGATVTAGSRNSVTDARGGYYISGLNNGSYTVTPSLTGYGFTPASTDVSISGADATGQNFTASQITVPTVTVTATDADASEPGSNTGRFTVSRNGSTASSVIVIYSVSGSATAGSDYAALSGSVTIPAGSATADIIVTPLDDTAAECTENVVVTLTSNAAYIIGSPATAAVTITDNDLPTVTIAASDSSAAEIGGDTGAVLVTRNGCANSALTVSYTLSGTASPGVDYQALSGSLTIPAGVTSASIIVTPIDDSLTEGDETVIVALAASASYVIGSPNSASVVIADNDSNHAPTVNAGADQTISILGLANLTGSATDDGLPGGALTYSWAKISGPGTVVAADPDAKNTTACFSMVGTYVLRLTANDGDLSASDDVTINVNAADPAKVVNAVNAGGPQITSGLGYHSDAWFTGGNPNSTTATIAATSDNALYQTDRSGDFSYDIPVGGGSQTYLLALKFAESSATGAGQRLFDVLVNGTLVSDNLDIFAQVGANTALDLIIPVSADTDVLHIQFQTEPGSALPAKINAIVVGAAQVLSPAMPGSLTATAAGSQINLAWTDQSANETSFQIDVSTDGLNYAPLVSVGANVTAYSHQGLNPSTTYYYHVRACNSAGCSAEAEASATTGSGPPAAPSNLTAIAQSATQINLSWSDNASNEDGFVIERSTTGKTYSVLATVGPNVTTYASTGLLKATRYYYRVRAFNNLGYSAYSNTANTRTKQK